MEIQWPLVLFTLLSGTGGTLAAFAGADAAIKKDLAAVRPSCIVAIALLIIGGICSAAHLAHPLRAIAIVSHPAGGIFLEAILLGILLVLLVLFAVLAGKGNQTPASAVGGLAALVGIALALFSGVSYMMPAHPAWSTPLLPLCYLTTALVAGGSCYGTIVRVRKIPTSLPVEVATGVCALVALASIAAYAFATGIAGSDLSLPALIAAIFSGVVPAICSFATRRTPRAWASAASFASALIGGGLIRVLMWMAISWGIAEASIALL